jgi:chromosome segregation protein
MSAARLLAIRLQGFKSFAEPTVVEFGPGISAIVGPNGSGKSNLADALRWALGEQGRSLRIRKAEDVIFAGSERRAALGMADVTIVLDNADRLLPLDYAVVEVGRRLYRSGENDYLVNRTRVRLRDLVELLEAAHLADNAFLFIGQGMVDQALALRPEERRPLFEEAAGVRRHERRRRRAEDQLLEAEANLGRVADLIAELRPHARRLAAQAERLAAQASVVRELVAAILADGHRRWAAAAERLEEAARQRRAALADLDRAVAEGRAAEDRTAALRTAVEALAAGVDEAGRAHEAALAKLTDLRLQEARRASEAEALARERQRLRATTAATRTELEAAEAVLAEPLPEPDLDTAATLAATERAIEDARAELAVLRRTHAAESERRAAVERAAAVRRAEAEAARRRRVDLGRRVAEAEADLADLRERLAAAVRERTLADERRTTAAAELEAAREAERRASAAEAAAAAALAASETLRAELLGAVGGARARLAELETLVGVDASAGRPTVDGRRVLDALVVPAEFRAAVAGALGDVLRAVVVEADRLPETSPDEGLFVVAEWADPIGEGHPAGRLEGSIAEVAGSSTAESFLARVRAAGGGRLADVVAGDETTLAAGLLGRSVWLPTAEAVVALGPALPPGWVAVSRDGRLRLEGPSLRVGDPDPSLDRRAALEQARRDVERLEAELARAEGDHRRRLGELETARAERRVADSNVRRAEAALEAAEARGRDLERAVARLEQDVRWHEANVAQLASALRSAEAALAAFDDPPPTSPVGAAAIGAADDPALEAELRRRDVALAELEARRAELAATIARQTEARRVAETRRARAEAARDLARARLAELERAAAELDARAAEALAGETTLGAELAAAEAAERTARATLDDRRLRLAAERQRLAAAEAAIGAYREEIRAAEDRHRALESAEVEARLALDACREQLVVELAALGEVGEGVLEALLLEAAGGTAAGRADTATVGVVAGSAVADGGEGGTGRASHLERLIETLVERWSTTPPPAEGPPASRIGQLKRRVAELGAVNPFAAAEYAEVRERLERLEAQETDLRAAIARTRRLIEELNDLVARQFATTFEALGAAFERRFHQLFGGGQARLVLTEPGDLTATGVDIVARPPGKKLQPLAMLSGGERALTAVALLFAMLEVRPVPFCVLDEVDAALDEANIGRFRTALRELATGTQFVVITHNRGTIEEADALYGVTVGDDSVSRVISLRLDEARALADRSRTAPAHRNRLAAEPTALP